MALEIRSERRYKRPQPIGTLDSNPAVDNTTAILTALAAVPDGGELFLPAGRYRVDGTLLVSGRSNLTINGGGSFVSWTDKSGVDLGIVDNNGNSTRAHWKITGCTNVTLTGVRVEGYRTDRDSTDPRFGRYMVATAFEHAYAIQGASQNTHLTDCTFINCGGDGIYVGGTGAPNVNTTVQRVTGSYPGRQSLGIVLANGLLIEDVNIQWGGRSGLDVEPNQSTHFVHDATFRRLDIGSQFYPFVIGGTVPLSGSEVCPGIVNKRERIVLEDCVGRNASSAHTAIMANRSGVDITVTRHTDTRQRTIYGTVFSAWQNVTVQDSTITSGTSSSTSYGVQLINCTGTLTITGSTFNGPVEGADQLYLAMNGTGAVTHSGNHWNMGASSD